MANAELHAEKGRWSEDLPARGGNRMAIRPRKISEPHMMLSAATRCLDKFCEAKERRVKMVVKS